MADLQETNNAKILIVEDEGVIGLDLQNHLLKKGYRIAGHALTAEQALELIEQDQPDLILMDIVLPGMMDGITAASIIRERWNIPVIFTTAYADIERIERAKLTHPFGFLLKPYQGRDIDVTLEMALYVSKVDRERKKTEEALAISEKNLRNLTAQIFSSLEKDRKRLAIELHDQLGQELTAVQVEVEYVKKILGAQISSPVKEKFKEIQTIIQSATEKIRDLSLFLWPSMMDDLGFAASLRWYLHRIGQRTNIEIFLELIGMTERLEPDIEITLYRIVQEALNNVVKHARAKRFEISFEQQYNRILGVLKDDGIGFNPKEIYSPNSDYMGIGLQGMKERAAMLGGSLSIQSAKGHGTRITIDIPV